MAVRIPGPQPTAGLERFYLDESTGWLSSERDSAGVVLSDPTARIRELADSGAPPIAAAVADTSGLESDQASLSSALDDQQNRTVADASSMNNLRGDPLAPAISQVNESVDKATGGLGAAPGLINGVPGVPISYSPPNQGAGGGDGI